MTDLQDLHDMPDDKFVRVFMDDNDRPFLWVAYENYLEFIHAIYDPGFHGMTWAVENGATANTRHKWEDRKFPIPDYILIDGRLIVITD